MKGCIIMKICRTCDLMFEDKDEFCTKCGRKLEVFQNDMPDINIDMELNTYSNGSPDVASRSSSSNSLTIALVVVALLIGGIGSYILFGRSSNETKAVTQKPPHSLTQPDQPTTQETEVKSTQNKKDTETSAQQSKVNQNSPKEVFLSFHKAITNKQMEEAYNILSPDYQKFMKSYENFANGYTTTLLSDVEELTVLYEDSNTASFAYKLKAVDRAGSGTKTQYFAGKAKLVNLNGRWRLDSTEAKRLSSQNDLDIQQSRYSEKTTTGYPYYLNGDPNCILVAGHMGSAWYVVRNSIKSTVISSYERTIIVDVISVANADKGNTAVGGRKTYSYYFNDSNGYASISDQPINYNGPLAVTRITNPTGAMSYYILTGKKWSRFGYGNDFYSRANR